jgi:phytoene dehydrogenase-like protein
MNKKYRYDAIVIGGGLSGLTAAAFLSQAGAKVIVLEQAGHVGGLFNSFWRSGYLFDGGIKAVENSAVMMPMLAQLGLLDQIQFMPGPVALVTGSRVQAIRHFKDVEAYFRLLSEIYPTQQVGLRRILQDTKSVFELLDGFLSFPIPFFDLPGTGNKARADWFKRNQAVFPGLPAAASMMRRELRPYLQQHLDQPGLINLLSDLFPDGTSVFFGLGYFRIFLDYYYPRGGIQAIPQVLSSAVQSWGGEIRLNARVDQVLLSGKQASGVRLSTGEEINSGYVIAASDLRQTLTQLVPEIILPKRFDRRLQAAEVSHSVFNVFLGIDRPAESLGLQGCSHIFYHPDLDGISEPDRISRPDYFSHVPQEISIPCMHQPELAPQGKTGIILSAMTSWQYRGGWERNPVEYANLKESITHELIGSLEKFIPRISGHIELCLSATPRTIASLTSNSQGAIMGWSYHRQRTLPRGNFWQMRSSVITPIPRLLTAGHWTYSPGGSPVAVLTGKLAAEAVLNQLKKNGE